MGNKGQIPWNKSKGVMSKTRSATHPIKGWGWYWRNQEDLDAYKKKLNDARRARTAGFGDDVEKFLKADAQADQAMAEVRSRQRFITHEMNRLKKKYGLGASANRTHLKVLAARTQDPDLMNLLNMMASKDLNDHEKIARIRKLFLEGRTPTDILYQTALIVGIQLRKKNEQ
jgi:hypothetical protein